MIWSEIADTLRSVIASVALETADPLWSTEWRDQKQTFASPTVQAKIVLHITSSADLMTEERYDEDNVSELHGMRNFTLNVQAKSYNLEYEQWAFEYAERIRTRLRRATPRAALLAANVALVSAGPILSLKAIEDGHAVSVANLDLFMRCGFTDRDATPTGWIESLELTTHLSSPADEWPVPPNLIAELLPPA